jgi:two-component system, chemotaxis family, chemotaxis protein CheY
MAFSVLIVDDCSAMQSVIRRILTISGFDLEACYFAGDGFEALSMLRRHTVDLVISDVNMPRLDGEAMLRCLAEDENLRNVPVVMVSSDGTRSRVERLVGMGAKGYIVKPFQPAALRAELERVLEVSNG